MAKSWEVEYTDELGRWWAGLTEAEQVSINMSVRVHMETSRKEGLIDGQ